MIYLIKLIYKINYLKYIKNIQITYKMKVINIDSKYDIDYKKPLGTGFSSIVYSAINKVTKKEVAIKRIDLSMERTSENEILNEYNIMKNISSHCENSVKLLDF